LIESDLIVKCDKCKKEYNDIMEIQEFIKVRFVGGYSSIFGDGTRVMADICQYCLKEMLGDNYRTEEIW